MSMNSVFCGAAQVAAPPMSEKSFSRTVVASEGTQPNIRRCHASAFVKVRSA
jgi:hypothetical protein